MDLIMDVEITEMKSRLEIYDAAALNSRSELKRWIMEIMRELDEHRRRVNEEQRVTPGVRDEQERER